MNKPDHIGHCKGCRWWDDMVERLGKPLTCPKYVDRDSAEMITIGRCMRHAPFHGVREDD